MNYEMVKRIHETAVLLSLGGFLARGVAMLADATWIARPLAKTLPHVVDTVLLLSALALAWMLHLSPANAPWLAAKVVGLVVYVALGMVALRFGRTKRVRLTAWVSALITFGYIVSVAITKDPRGFLLNVLR